MLSRRSFLKWAGGAAAAAVAVKALPALELDPERALWVPGKKAIFIPEVQPAYFRPGWNPDQWTPQDRLDRPLVLAQSRWMIDRNGLAVPLTPEGYRAGYQIVDSMIDILAPEMLTVVAAKSDWWESHKRTTRTRGW